MEREREREGEREKERKREREREREMEGEREGEGEGEGEGERSAPADSQRCLVQTAQQTWGTEQDRPNNKHHTITVFTSQTTNLKDMNRKRRSEANILASV